MARTDRPTKPPSPAQRAWRKTFGEKWGGRMRELVKREREANNGTAR